VSLEESIIKVNKTFFMQYLQAQAFMPLSIRKKEIMSLNNFFREVYLGCNNRKVPNNGNKDAVVKNGDKISCRNRYFL
jgi:hypothetical protein